MKSKDTATVEVYPEGCDVRSYERLYAKGYVPSKKGPMQKPVRKAKRLKTPALESVETIFGYPTAEFMQQQYK